MQVYELINLLKKMPPQFVVKVDDGKYVLDPTEVEVDSRDYVIIRT